jgi:hypothetical protein
VSDRNSCCHCRASCEEPSDSCDYSDAPAADDDDEDDAPAADDDDEDEDGEFTGDTEGSCYDLQDTHTVSCGVTRDDCMEIEGVWYRPGHISTYSGSDCCHCRANCPAEGLTEGCNFNDEDEDDEDDEDGEFTGDTEGSCYDLQDTHTVSCGVTRDDCMEIDGVWYRPGHISTYSGSDCCHCRANCPAEGLTEGCNFNDEDAETSTSPPSGQGPEEDPVQDSGAYAVLGVALLLF